MDDKTTFNPFKEVSKEFESLLQRPEIEEILRNTCFSSIDQVLQYLASKQNLTMSGRLSPETQELVVSLVDKLQEKRSIIDGHPTWRKWKPLLSDLFFFYEYLYEEGGDSSFWPLIGHSTFSHSSNKRIIPADRNNYETRVALRDTNGITRAEVLRTLGLSSWHKNPQEYLETGKFTLTTSQQVLTTYNIMNDVLMPSGEDKPVTGDVRYQAIQEGELVIRMFGMKDDDNLLTSHNVLSATIKTETYSRTLKPTSQRSLTNLLELASPTSMKVHRGFWNIFKLLEAGCIEKHSMDFEDYIYKQYNEMKTMFPKTHPRRVIFTGHSMGCALAAIAIYRLLNRFRVDAEFCNSLHLIIFGSPKFARLAFTKWLEANLPNRLLYISLKKDPVVKQPPIPGWHAPCTEKIEFTSKVFAKAVKKHVKETKEESPLSVEHFRYWNVIRFCAISLSSEEMLTDAQILNLLDQQNFAQIKEHIFSVANRMHEARDKFGQYPLHIAVSHEPIVSLLLQHNADCNVADFEGTTPLHRACRDGLFSVIRLLLQNEANINVQNYKGISPFHYLCRLTTEQIEEHKAIIREFIERNVNVNCHSTTGETPFLFGLSSKFSSEIAEYLLKNGCDQSIQDGRGYNALCHALKSNTRLDVIKVLLEYNADVNHITKDNLTPIKLATLHKDPNVLMLLLQTVKFVGVNWQQNVYSPRLAPSAPLS